MQDMVLIGASGLGKEVAYLVDEINRQEYQYRILGFVDSQVPKGTRIYRSYEVLGDDSFLINFPGSVSAAFAIGTPSIKANVWKKLSKNTNLSFPNLIHPSVSYHREGVRMGRGNVFLAGVCLTTDIRIGSFNLFNQNVTGGHDLVVGDLCVFNPGCNLSGWVQIGDNCLVGTGSQILERLSLGEGVTVGAGAVVTKSIESKRTVVGIPATQIKRAA